MKNASKIATAAARLLGAAVIATAAGAAEITLIASTAIVYATARPINARETEAARDFVKFLSSKSVVPIARKMGLDPA